MSSLQIVNCVRLENAALGIRVPKRGYAEHEAVICSDATVYTESPRLVAFLPRSDAVSVMLVTKRSVFVP